MQFALWDDLWSFVANTIISTLGIVCSGIKKVPTEYRLVSVGVSVGPAYIPSKACKSKVQSCTSGVKDTSKKAHEREIK